MSEITNAERMMLELLRVQHCTANVLNTNTLSKLKIRGLVTWYTSPNGAYIWEPSEAGYAAVEAYSDMIGQGDE